MADFDAIIIGAGVVGLSCAYELAGRGLDVLVLEKHERIGQETSSHNSQVLHAGIYYPAGSLKARLCVQGRAMLVSRLASWGIDHRMCGKLIVALTEDEIAGLQDLKRRGNANGVEGLEIIGASEAAKIEPNIKAAAALWSPQTGIFDVSAYIKALEARSIDAGAKILCNAPVTGVEKGGAIRVMTAARGDATCSMLINAAGLFADRVAKLCGFEGPEIHPCRGEYSSVVPSKSGLIRGLVYPAPDAHSLGIHLTKTTGGELWIGPSVKFIDDPTDYETDRDPPRAFFAQARSLCPAIESADLRLGPSGIRPKLTGPEGGFADFFIRKQPDDPRILHLIGVDSPGLTSSPAIASFARDLMDA